MTICIYKASQVVLVVKNPPANARDTKDLGLSPVSGRSLGEGNGNLPGASTGVPTHDKVMWESPDGQGESGLKRPPGPVRASTLKPKSVCFTIS